MFLVSRRGVGAGQVREREGRAEGGAVPVAGASRRRGDAVPRAIEPGDRTAVRREDLRFGSRRLGQRSSHAKREFDIEALVIGNEMLHSIGDYGSRLNANRLGARRVRDRRTEGTGGRERPRVVG